jgi:branched-chain amino acid transport system substrate-binding protein
MKVKLGLAASVAAMALLALTSAVQADVTIGVVHSLTGGASAQGVPQNQAIALALPKEIGGEKVKVIVLDDATDPAVAARNATKLIEDEKVDLIIGPTITPSAISMAQIATAAKVPYMPAAPVKLGDARDEWIFNVPPPPEKWILPVVADFKARGIKTVGFLGFSDAWGDITMAALKKYAAEGGYEIIADERYARADTSVTGQVLRLVSANPDAVFLGVSGAPGVLGNLSVKERYQGPIYNSNGVFNATFLTLGGAALEGVHAVIGAIGVADQLPESEARKAVALDFVSKYNAEHGEGKADAISGFGYDSGLIAVAGIEYALTKAKPGTQEFRAAFVEGLRNLDRLPGTHSYYTFADPTWPWGVGDDAAFLVKVEGGKWRLAN